MEPPLRSAPSWDLGLGWGEGKASRAASRRRGFLGFSNIYLIIASDAALGQNTHCSRTHAHTHTHTHQDKAKKSQTSAAESRAGGHALSSQAPVQGTLSAFYGPGQHHQAMFLLLLLARQTSAQLWARLLSPVLPDTSARLIGPATFRIPL